jgi:hypothetical protein
MSFNRYLNVNNTSYKYTDPKGESPLSAFGFGSSAGKLATTMKMSDNTAGVVTEVTNVMTSAKKDELQGN